MRAPPTITKQFGFICAFLALVEGFYLTLQPGQPRSIPEQIEAQLLQEQTDPTQRSHRRLVLAIERFTVDHHRLPTNLTALVPLYLPAVPKPPTETSEAGRGVTATWRYYPTGGTYRLEVLTSAGESTDSAATTANRAHATPEPSPPPFDPTDLRDPFHPPALRPAPAEADPNRPPLERYDLSELRLTAVIATGQDFSNATLEDSGGRGFIVKIGTKVGRNGGEVTAIFGNQIIIQETTVDTAGRPKVTEIGLKLRASAEEPSRPTTKLQP